MNVLMPKREARLSDLPGVTPAARVARRLVPCAALVAALAVAAAPNDDQTDSTRSVAEARFAIAFESVRSGDLVFRQGQSLVSEVVLRADPDSLYSHVGIAYTRGDDALVVHAAPGPSFADEAPVRADPLAAFIEPGVARVITIRRPKDTATAQRAADVALSYLRDGVVFDASFDLRSDTAMYCTELVWRAFIASGLDLTEGHFDELMLPVGAGPYILPSRLIHSPHLNHVLTLGAQHEETP